MEKKITANTTKEKVVSIEELTKNDNKLNAVNRDYQFFKIQIYADKVHTFTTIYASLAFVAFSLISIFSALYYQGFFEVKQSMMLTGYIGIAVIVVIVVFAVGNMTKTYLKDVQKISDMIEAVNNGDPLPTLVELPKWEKDNEIKKEKEDLH